MSTRLARACTEYPEPVTARAFERLLDEAHVSTAVQAESTGTTGAEIALTVNR